jgi:hypothetical protein
MPSRKTTKAAEAAAAKLPAIPKELIDQFVTGPMSPEAVQAASMAFKKIHACRHRSCARCAAVARQRWAEQELARLLPGAHQHVVFTLPHELLGLWTHNRGPMTTLLMRSTQQALLQALEDPRHLGALPGIVQSLHT